MIFLPDVNVWLALVYAQHTHAAAARDFVEAEQMPELALCRVTQMALLRLATNTAVMGEDVMKPDAAWKMLDLLGGQEGVVFAREPDNIDVVWREETEYVRSGSNFWTDAYLAAFARLTGYTLVTFDRGFSKYKKARVRILSRASG
jgi:hypothetical protein